MRNILTTITLAVLPMIAMGQTCFKDGTTWETLRCGIVSGDKEPVCETETASLNGMVDIDGYQALKMFCSDATSKKSEPYIYIRTDGDKVYFKPAGVDDAPWYLMYDFGLKVGDGCDVYSSWNIGYYPKMDKAYVKCIGIDQDRESGLTAMTMEEYFGDAPDVHKSEGTFVWYKGVSSSLGVLFNYGLGLDGLSTRLMKVANDGEVVYSYVPTSIGNVKTATFKTKVNGLNVTVDDIGSSDKVSLYTVDGKLVKEAVAKEGSVNMTLPGNGVYMLKVGTQAMKIVVGK
ncbi:MAG TPA: hypothetical protein DEQ27_05370 [Prevotella sp.]|nr:hypothetical protein [Prevotella sp.]